MNTISLRIQDYLQNIPPFSFLIKEEQARVSEQIVVEYYEKEEFIFKTSESVNQFFYLVKEGAVGLFKAENQLVDECDEGDIFGLRAMIRKGNYKLSAKAIEESILYAIPLKIYEDLLAQNNQASQFIIQSFANTLVGKETSENNAEANNNVLEDELTANYSKNPVICSEDTSVESAAQIMTVKRVGSLIICKNNKPIGIITDKDLRTKIATGKHSIKEKVTAIMSSPVICYPHDLSVAEAQIAMLKNQITHLCITRDGTKNSEIIGVLSEHDIILIRENNPSVLIKQIKRCYSDEQLRDIKEKSNKLLKRYLQQKVSIVFVAKIVAAINNTLTARAIELAKDSLGMATSVPFVWISLGSQGRKEQILPTDQDNAIVFEDTQDPTVKDYFLKLAKQVTASLNTLGFEYCPANMMASNKEWCLPLSKWKQQFSKWITTPTEDNLMLSTIFFDFEPVYGKKYLADELNNHISYTLKKSTIFYQYLGKNALQNPPPLSFFRQFLVEESGEHKDQFDIKARVMMPLVDAARLLCLEQKSDVRNTIDRYKLLAEKEPQNQQVYQQCEKAYKTLLQFRTEHGLKNKNSGRFIVLSDLSKLEKLELKSCFKAVKEIQNLVLVRYQLAQML